MSQYHHFVAEGRMPLSAPVLGFPYTATGRPTIEELIQRSGERTKPATAVDLTYVATTIMEQGVGALQRDFYELYEPLLETARSLKDLEQMGITHPTKFDTPLSENVDPQHAHVCMEIAKTYGIQTMTQWENTLRQADAAQRTLDELSNVRLQPLNVMTPLPRNFIYVNEDMNNASAHMMADYNGKHQEKLHARQH